MASQNKDSKENKNRSKTKELTILIES